MIEIIHLCAGFPWGLRSLVVFFGLQLSNIIHMQMDHFIGLRKMSPVKDIIGLNHMFGHMFQSI